MKFDYLSKNQQKIKRLFVTLALMSSADAGFSLQLHSFKCVKKDDTEVKINADQVKGSFSKELKKYYIGLDDYSTLHSLCGENLSYIEAKRKLWFFPSFMFSYRTISPLKGDRLSQESVDPSYMAIRGLVVIGAGAAGVVAYNNRGREISWQKEREEEVGLKEEVNQLIKEEENRPEVRETDLREPQTRKNLAPQISAKTIKKITFASQPKGVRDELGILHSDDYEKFSEEVCSDLGIGDFQSEPVGLAEEVNILLLDDHGKMLHRFLNEFLSRNIEEESRGLIEFFPLANEEIASLHDISTDDVSAFRQHGMFHKLEINTERISEITDGRLQFKPVNSKWADGISLTWDSHTHNRKINFYMPRYFYLDASTLPTIARRLARTEKHFASHTPRILNALEGKSIQGLISLLDGHFRASRQVQGNLAPGRLETVTKFFPKHAEGCFEQIWDPRSQFFPDGIHYSVHMGGLRRAKENVNFFEDFSETSRTLIEGYDLGYTIKADISDAIREILGKQEGFKFFKIEEW